MANLRARTWQRRTALRTSIIFVYYSRMSHIFCVVLLLLSSLSSQFRNFIRGHWQMWASSSWFACATPQLERTTFHKQHELTQLKTASENVSNVLAKPVRLRTAPVITIPSKNNDDSEVERDVKYTLDRAAFFWIGIDLMPMFLA